MNHESVIERIMSGEVEEEGKLKPRLTVILHPNTSRLDIILNDRKFNNEQYSFSRQTEPAGSEKELLDYCNTHVIGVQKAETCKNKLKLEISDGMMLREIVPQVVTAVKRCWSTIEPYDPEIFVDNRRWDVEPVRDSDGWEKKPGVKQTPCKINIGIPYTPWSDDL